MGCGPAKPYQAPASSAEADPLKLDWMRGNPPPPEKRVQFRDGSFFVFPKMRWLFAHIKEVMTAARILVSDPKLS